MLRVFPFPLTITAFQFLVGAVLASAMWLEGLHKKPEGNFVDTVSWRCCCCWRRCGGSGAGARLCEVLLTLLLWRVTASAAAWLYCQLLGRSGLRVQLHHRNPTQSL